MVVTVVGTPDAAHELDARAADPHEGGEEGDRPDEVERRVRVVEDEGVEEEDQEGDPAYKAQEAEPPLRRTPENHRSA